MKLQTLTLALFVTITVAGEIAEAQRRGGFGGPGGFGGSGRRSEKRLDPEELEFTDGVGTIKDMKTFDKLSYKGEEVMIDTHLADQQFVKFQIERADTEKPQMYFINTKTHRAHPMFMQAIGLSGGRGGPGFGRGGPGGGRAGTMRGVLIYHPRLKDPSGNVGLFTFEYEPNDRYKFEKIKLSNDLLIKFMPTLKGKLVYLPMPYAESTYKSEKATYDKSEVTVWLREKIESKIGYLPLNLSESFGRLTNLELNKLPSPRDIVICKILPNEMPRVAGIISAVRQTPLSHVNLRAIQDNAPNAFIANVEKNEQIKSLLGKYVYYKVTPNKYELREATSVEVENYFAKIRPKDVQKPVRDLTNKKVQELSDLYFEDSKSIGVKAANVAVLGQMKFKKGTAPEGHAVPFYFYDEFMKHNKFYEKVKSVLQNEQFKKDIEKQKADLEKLRAEIKNGKMPEWMLVALDKVHKTYPEGQSLRCRSSTNNEDLPGFSGAGLYSSCTHKKEEGHISKSIKQVFASLWNFRAFEEREFYRVDHFQAAMGVLIHPNYKGELANGVGVSADILYETKGTYYLNTQIGEDLVTNPDDQSVPEEMIVDWWQGSRYMIKRASNRTKDGREILTAEQRDLLRKYLGKIHARFAKLYGKKIDDEKFAMEIEFKITSDLRLVIKQARPWIFPKKVDFTSK